MGQSPPISSRSRSTVRSAGTRAIAVIEADGFVRHKQPPRKSIAVPGVPIPLIVAGCDQASRVRSR